MFDLSTQQAFCLPNSAFHRPTGLVSTSATKWTCSARADRHQSVTRRTALIALGGLSLQLLGAKLQPSSAAEEKNDDERPTMGFLTKSGLKFVDFEVGTGPTPKWGDLVNFQYVTYTISPTGDSLIKHDSSYDVDKYGYLMHHGNGEQILGLEEAIHTMRVGGRRRCIIPPNLAYIDADLGPVPAPDWKRRRLSKALKETGGTVVFDIELLKVRADPLDRGYYTDLTPTEEEMIKFINPEGKTEFEITFENGEKKVIETGP